MVTSMTVIPPATIASTTAMASLPEPARKTGMIPASSSCCCTSFDILFSFDPNQMLTGNARGAAQHHALYFCARSHAGVPRGGHGERSMGYSASDGPGRRFSHEHSINQAGGE